MPGPSELLAADSLRHQAEMTALASVFYPSLAEIGQISPVGQQELPEVFRSLLAHDDHMTVTLEAHHESLVKVSVLQECREGDFYTRASILARQSDRAPVQFGIMRINLAALPDLVRQQIEQHQAPLGRLLIRNNLLREVELRALWRIVAGPVLSQALNLEQGSETYGRSARILVDRSPVVELLEITRTDV